MRRRDDTPPSAPAQLPKQHPGPKSLYNCARDVLVKYINIVEDVGDIEYRILQPVLRKITSPLQLKKLETASPQLRGEDAELWQKFIIRDFGEAALAKYVPGNPRSWRKIYERHQKEAASAQDSAKEALKAKFRELSTQKSGMRSQLVAASSLPPLKRKTPWGGFGGGGGGGGSGWGASANNWDVKAGSKTKNIVQRARREAKELSIFQGRNSKLAVPMHQLQSGRVSRDMKEKMRMAEALKQKARDEAEKKRMTNAKVIYDDDDDDGYGETKKERERREREDRLKAAKGRLVVGGSSSTPGPAKVEPRVIKRKSYADPFHRPSKVARR